jgi:hypothetical protein
LAVTPAAPVIEKVHVFVLLPLLEHAPDHTADRPFVTLNVTACPVGNEAEPLDPTATLMPAGLEVTRSPDRPVAVTVNVAPCDAGVTVRPAVLVDPPAVAVMVTGVDVVTAVVVIAKVTIVAPCVTDTLVGTVASAVLLDSVTEYPPAGAAAVKVTVPCADEPPLTLVGFTETADSAAGAGGGPTAWGVKRRTEENALAVPAELIVRTRHQCCRAANVGRLSCDADTD